jgi:hypothetical protein
MAPHIAGISFAHHNQYYLQKIILHKYYVPITIYAKIGKNDLSPVIEKGE